MIIKSSYRSGYRAAAVYLRDIGKNERTRLVEISDPDANTLEQAFHNMWTIACQTRATKPLHHISINPMKDERLTDEQVFKIIERCEQKYGYKEGEHQRVVVEHIKDGRQHFHVMWCRVSLTTGRVVKAGEHWKKSKQVCREMERELGLKRPTPRRFMPRFAYKPASLGVVSRHKPTIWAKANHRPKPMPFAPPKERSTANKDKPRWTLPMPIDPLRERAAMIAWAYKHHRADILAEYGIYVTFDI